MPPGAGHADLPLLGVGMTQSDRQRSGSILLRVLVAADRLEHDFGVAADVWSATSFGELRKDGIACDRWNLLNPSATPKVPFVTKQLGDRAAETARRLSAPGAKARAYRA